MRRLRVERVKVGNLELPEREGHHARDVLRLKVGAEVEVFDADGGCGGGTIVRSDAKKVVVRVEKMQERSGVQFEWWGAAAIPKGTRGDWMVEKLSELGTGGLV